MQNFWVGFPLGALKQEAPMRGIKTFVTGEVR